MNSIVAGIVAVEGVLFLAVVGILIYLIVRRIEAKGNETFEKRDN